MRKEIENRKIKKNSHSKFCLGVLTYQNSGSRKNKREGTNNEKIKE